MNIIAEPIPWPKFDSTGFIIVDNEIINIIPSTNEVNLSSETEIESIEVHKERMVTFAKLTNDLSNLEICKPSNLSLQSIDISLIKLNPVKPVDINNSTPSTSQINEVITLDNPAIVIPNSPIDPKITSSIVDQSNNQVVNPTVDIDKQKSKIKNNTKPSPAKTVTPNKSNNKKVIPSG